jgi:nucleoside-diphosphate-sugar epimerase
MSIHLHLLGGAGRIGTALVESLLAEPLDDLSVISIYCDSTKAVTLQERQSPDCRTRIQARGYAAFGRSTLPNEESAFLEGRQVVVNLRGVNDKKQWLNQPLDAMELHTQACRCVIDSDLWMHSSVEVIHLSSQLCDLIEGPNALEQICEGQESYRRPYMVSRLHQEAMLSAHAFQRGIPTSFVRLPAVYGFRDDYKSPWVLNSLSKQWNQLQKVEPRSPQSMIYLSHRQPLVGYLRSLIVHPKSEQNLRTVRYLRPPMLAMTVESLASMIQAPGGVDFSSPTNSSAMALIGSGDVQESDRLSHLQLLSYTIANLQHHG